MPRTLSPSEQQPAIDSLGLDLLDATFQPKPKEQWVGRLRYVVVPLLAVLAIAATIYLLEDKPVGLETEQEVSRATSAGGSGSARPVQVTASSEELSKTPAPRIGYPAPDFTLTNLDGRPTRLSDFRGQAVFLNFFATWCPPCRAEMPDILATYEENKMKSAVVLAVDLQEEQKTVKAYADTVRLTFPIVLDRSGKVAALYRITAIPTSFFIDKEGIVRDMQIGAMSKSLMQTRLQKAIQGEGG